MLLSILEGVHGQTHEFMKCLNAHMCIQSTVRHMGHNPITISEDAYSALSSMKEKNESFT